MKSMKLLSLVLLASFISCATPVEKVRSVKMKTSEPSKDCVQVGAVVASSLREKESDEEIRTRLEQRASAKGGNYIRLDTVDEKGGLTGMAFRCP
jgi:hypothetical protein